MHTHSHALITWAAARRLETGTPGVAVWAASGAVLPDLPVVGGVIWLGVRRRGWFTRRELCVEACEKGPFGAPDAALHSALPVAALLALHPAFGAKGRRARLAFLLGWAAHVLADALTHAEDVRPILWPLSGRRFRSPISYWDHRYHARPFALIEHGALLLVAARTISHNFSPGG